MSQREHGTLCLQVMVPQALRVMTAKQSYPLIQSQENNESIIVDCDCDLVISIAERPVVEFEYGNTFESPPEDQ